MAKQYVLNGTGTYATLAKKFISGEVYTAAELGRLVNSVDESGDNYFVSAEAEYEEEFGLAVGVGKKSIKIGKKSAKTDTNVAYVIKGAGDELDDIIDLDRDDKSESLGSEEDKITI